MGFFKELKRRNVIKETLAYLVVSWVLLQVGAVVLPIVDAPDWVLKTETFFLAIGLPVWILFSWAYQVTPEGIKKTKKIEGEDLDSLISDKKWNVIIVVFLILAIGVSFINKPDSKTNSVVSNDPESVALDKSIAVLAFLDMSPAKDQEYLSDGIAEEIQGLLCKFEDLKVSGLTSSFSYKNKGVDLKRIGVELGVSNILEGSVKKFSDKIIVSVRLTDAENGFTHINESYEDVLENIFPLQAKIAKDIATKIKSRLSLNDEQLLSSKKIDPVAYENYLKGKGHFVNGPVNSIPGEIFRAKNYFKAAVELDSTFADAVAYLALSYFNLGDWAIQRDQAEKIEIALDSAKLLSRKALTIDPLSSSAHLAMGSLYFHEHNWIMAEQMKRKATTLNKGGAEEKVILASFLGQFGQAEEALSLVQEAIRLDPLEPKYKEYLLRDLYRSRRFDECIRQGKLLLEANPNSIAPDQFMWMSYDALNDEDNSSLSFSSYLEKTGFHQGAELFKEFDYKTALQKLIDLQSTVKFLQSPVIRASFYAYLRDRENTLYDLNLAIELGQSQISFINQPNFDFLRDDPEFQVIYEKAGFKAYDEYRKAK